ncbi:hypothetical protein [Schlesneria paludicola]|uniref:hypothetical protein n=1 Tax=Schlesneria paludicola TaxID=360056 RepID=UPI0012FAA256|nr:hypothetical protein [Schlesneria paludicola]
MNRNLFLLTLAVACGCASRSMNTDLLQARIREQAIQLAETQREMAETQSELKQAKIEAARLKSELGQTDVRRDASARMLAELHRVHIYPLASGGLNKDNAPGDDAVVVQFAPLNRNNQPLQLAGEVQITLRDPKLAEPKQVIGQWSFSADECRPKWTRGLSSSGFQFTLPIERPVQHDSLLVQIRFQPTEDQRFDATQVVKVNAPAGMATVQAARAGRQAVQVVDDVDEFVPPAGFPQETAEEEEFAEPEFSDSDKEPSKTGRAILHSSSWTEDSIPRFR